jgi:hypothetical protein
VPGISGHDQFSLVEHWDGIQWSVVPSPSPSPADGLTWIGLQAVAAAGPDDVWAAGYKNDVDGAGIYVGTHCVVLHWDGAEWTEATIPLPGGGSSVHQQASGDEIHAIEVVSADDVWVVGSWFEFLPSDAVVRTPLAMHWDGSSFTVTDVPMVYPGRRHVLTGVAAAAPDDVWAVGSAGGDALLYHHDGRSWSHVPLSLPSGRNGFHDVAVIASDDAWITGTTSDFAAGTSDTLIHHWDGTSWTRVPSPAGGGRFAAWGADDVLTTGGLGGIAHWDGTSWTAQPEPQFIPWAGVADAAAVGPCQVWAVGAKTVAGDARTFAARLETGTGLPLWPVLERPSVTWEPDDPIGWRPGGRAPIGRSLGRTTLADDSSSRLRVRR